MYQYLKRSLKRALKELLNHFKSVVASLRACLFIAQISKRFSIKFNEFFKKGIDKIQNQSYIESVISTHLDRVLTKNKTLFKGGIDYVWINTFQP
ncbi:MAG: hypothetical protein K0S71_1658 [Clostridia bacterium]|jgi:hypothetical protein|nr:hypothetical protein [Clostridia bacterium]